MGGIPFISEEISSLLSKFAEEVDRVVKYGIDKTPDLERLLMQIIDSLFYPRLIVKQIAVISVIQVLLMCVSSLNNLWDKVVMRITSRGRKKKALLDKMKETKSFDEWQDAAIELDVLQGNDLWRVEDDSSLVDHKTLQRRIMFIQEMLRRGDIFDLMFRLRSGLSRDQFGMQHEGLFSKAMAGTKLIVERYLDTVTDGLNFICDSPIADEEVN
jgi:hypothetical protein